MKFLVDTDNIKYNTLVNIAKDMGYKEGNLYNWLEDNTQKIDLEPLKCNWKETPKSEIEYLIIQALERYKVNDIKEWIEKSPKDIWDKDNNSGDVGTLEYNFEEFCANRRINIAKDCAKEIKEYLEGINDFSSLRWSEYQDIQNRSLQEAQNIGFTSDNIIMDVGPDGVSYKLRYTNR